MNHPVWGVIGAIGFSAFIAVIIVGIQSCEDHMASKHTGVACAEICAPYPVHRVCPHCTNWCDCGGAQ